MENWVCADAESPTRSESRVFLAVASIFLIPLPVIGLALSLLVAVLAFVNLAFGYCLGCQIFFQLERRGVLKPS